MANAFFNLRLQFPKKQLFREQFYICQWAQLLFRSRFPRLPIRAGKGRDFPPLKHLSHAPCIFPHFTATWGQISGINSAPKNTVRNIIRRVCNLRVEIWPPTWAWLVKLTRQAPNLLPFQSAAAVIWQKAVCKNTYARPGAPGKTHTRRAAEFTMGPTQHAPVIKIATRAQHSHTHQTVLK
jgi:hypothetical protein